MKNLFTITLILFFIHTMNAQQQDCIICPEMLGLATNVEHGVNISTLTPSARTLIASSEEQKNIKQEKTNKSKVAKKADRNKNTRNKKSSVVTVVQEDIMGFAADASSTQEETYYQVETSEKEVSGEDCGCGEVAETEESVTVEIEKTFTLYPNPAHHWVVINAEHLGEGDYKIFLKDTQGNIIKERTLTESTTKLDLQRMKKGVYFVTLRNETDHTTLIQKVTVQ